MQPIHFKYLCYLQPTINIDIKSVGLLKTYHTMIWKIEIFMVIGSALWAKALALTEEPRRKNVGRS